MLKLVCLFISVSFLYSGYALGAEVRKNEVICLADLVPDAGPSFGYSIDTDGDFIIVGEPLRNRVHVFSKTEATWSLFRVISPSPSQIEEAGSVTGFGAGLAMKGTKIAVGWVHEETANDGTQKRHSAVFSIDVLPEDRGLNELFTALNNDELSYGHAIAVDESHVVISTIGRNADNFLQGQIVVSKLEGGSDHRVLRPPEGTNQIGFGSALALYKGQLFVGSNRDGAAGSVFRTMISDEKGWLKIPLDESVPSASYASDIVISEKFGVFSGRGAMGEGASAIAFMSEGSIDEIKYFTPSGKVAASDDFAYIISLPPLRLGADEDTKAPKTEVSAVDSEGRLNRYSNIDKELGLAGEYSWSISAAGEHVVVSNAFASAGCPVAVIPASQIWESSDPAQ